MILWELDASVPVSAMSKEGELKKEAYYINDT